jgi:hypothetical protein
MVARLIEKNKAIELRKKGYSYSDIQKNISVSRGLLSYWFKDLVLTDEERLVIESKILTNRQKGLHKSCETNRNLRLNREIVVFEDAKRIFSKMREDVSFIIGISLYWAEGAKRHNVFQFVNSDPDMVCFMYKWIQKYLEMERSKIRFRLFIHDIPGYENIEMFWGSKLGLKPDIFQKTIYQPTKFRFKKNPDYKGCMRLSISNVYVLRLMKAWQKLLIQYYGDMRS